ncbi:RNA polymerase sigma-70 factor (family 1) [Pedobacter africanus]|uniref:RNA polymerase sigma-70 factor (Family 1) n=1 Tax=Pedobacter africanus TaxID=151894 RepID=A0ACC6L1M0_9SPHI|nr:sigma-70 family RNA polymerase sigma factor [Pedobacter africanus]MDR6785533.1 RNA polymerase sigma-70 factor (family 1) [Pedobacter africanus]
MLDYSKHSDSELAGLCRAGDDAAFKEIYIRYDKLLYIFALKKLEDENEAMDVVQDVFVWILSNREKFALKTTLSGYLYKSVLNRIFDIFRRQNTIRKYITKGDHFVEVDSYETDYLIRENDIRTMIDKEIATMPPRMREVYELKHKENADAAEIAKRLDISEHTVNVHLQRGLKHLKERLGLVVYVLFILNP